MARPAKTKEKLIALIDEQDNHEWTVDQLHAELLERGWEVNYSSVFRALNQLQLDGFITKIASDTERAVFEKNDKHHDHLKCEICGKFLSLDCVFGGELARAIESETGFQVRRHFFTATGFCAKCTGKGEL